MEQKCFIFSFYSYWNQELFCLFWMNANDYATVNEWLAGQYPARQDNLMILFYGSHFVPFSFQSWLINLTLIQPFCKKIFLNRREIEGTVWIALCANPFLLLNKIINYSSKLPPLFLCVSVVFVLRLRVERDMGEMLEISYSYLHFQSKFLTYQIQKVKFDNYNNRSFLFKLPYVKAIVE